MPFIINDVDPLNPAVRKVERAWTTIVRIDQEWGKKNVIAKEPYIVWVRERAKIVNIPFFFESSSFPPVPEPEDVDKLADKIKELKLENIQV